MRTRRRPVLDRAPVCDEPALDGWTLITQDRLELAHHYLHIMRQMNRATYSPARPEREVRRMAGAPCEYYYYVGAGFELVLGFKWLKRLRQYRIMSTGFVGNIDSKEALDRIAAKLHEFAKRKCVNRLVAIRPWTMDSPRILELYDLLFQHPALRVRGGHHLADGEYLWIGFP